MKLDDKLVKELQNNEQIIHVVPAQELQQEWEWATTKDGVKTGAGFVSPFLDSIVAAKLIRNFGFMTSGKVLIKQYKGKEYVIFKGMPGVRKVFKGTRYLTNNPNVVRMAIGPKGIIKSVKGGFVITMVLSVGIELFDYIIRDTATLSELLGTVTSDLIKIGLSSIAGAVAGLTVGSAAVIGSIAAAPLIAAIAVGVVTGYLLDKLDKRIGATNALIRGYEQIGIKLDEIKWEINRNINYLEDNPWMIPCLFGPCTGIRGY
ncbi:MAG: hypothetical protein P8101_05825 [Candidatus Thiodiazotropha sp.]|jgi:hypothetical protein